MERTERGTFAPGVSGNPSGRPRRTIDLSAMLDEALATAPEGSSYKTVADEVVAALLRRCCAGDVQAIRLVIDRIDGPTVPVIETSMRQLVVRFEEDKAEGGVAA